MNTYSIDNKEIDYLYLGDKNDRSWYIQMLYNACKHDIFSIIIILEGAKMIEINDDSIKLSTVISEYIEGTLNHINNV